MKKFFVLYRTRGYRFESPRTITIYADNKTEARQNAIMRIGDVYSIVKVVPAAD